MEHIKNITKLIGIKDLNIKILLVIKLQSHIEIRAELDYPASLSTLVEPWWPLALPSWRHLTRHLCLTEPWKITGESCKKTAESSPTRLSTPEPFDKLWHLEKLSRKPWIFRLSYAITMNFTSYCSFIFKRSVLRLSLDSFTTIWVLSTQVFQEFFELF